MICDAESKLFDLFALYEILSELEVGFLWFLSIDADERVI